MSNSKENAVQDVHRVESNTTTTMSTKDLGVAMRPGVDLKKGKYPGFGYAEREKEGILIQKDVTIPLRNGTKLYANIYRPMGQSGIPAIICYAPFGKHGPVEMEKTFAGSGVPFEKLSDETIFEVFDPMAWAKDGYALVYVDGVGSWASEGEVLFFGPEEARAGYDVIEWAAAQEWSNGKIGWGAVSYYAMSAWEVAALRPPHLAAIMPWEGASDVYNECYFHGGIPMMPMTHSWHHLTTFSLTQVEDTEAGTCNHPLRDDYWRSKVADWSRIEVPTYAVSGWPNDLHLRGTLEAWMKTSSQHKYLDIHGGKEWAEFYSDWAYRRQKSFFDHFLKGIENDVPSWPKVRLAERSGGSEWNFRAEQEFPLSRAQYVPLYLDAGSATMGVERSATESSIRYDSTDRNGQAIFDFKFTEKTEITGYSKLRLWVATTGTNDADLFVGLKKLDKNGNEVNFTFSQMFDDGPIVLGWLRVSHRELDEKLSRPEHPVLKHERHLWLTSEDPVPVDIEIWPTSVNFEAGETLRLVVKGTQITFHPDSMFELKYGPMNNFGDHILYTGGKYDSHLLIPVIP
jgi:hypothetical protein